MKDQYFGDVNDYRKYGLLRAVAKVCQFSVGICWMLTEQDGSQDGEFRKYLHEPSKWQHYDPELHKYLQRLVEPNTQRSVSLAQRWNLIPNATYFDRLLTDHRDERRVFFEDAWEQLAKCPIIFFDPDNGLEVKSKLIGNKDSCKYLYWNEVEETFANGHSIIIYQHFPRVKREDFIRSVTDESKKRTGSSDVHSFVTSNVLFLLIAQREHASELQSLHDLMDSCWSGQITPLRH